MELRRGSVEREVVGGNRKVALRWEEEEKLIEVAVEALHLEGHPGGLGKIGKARMGLLGGKAGTLSIPRAHPICIIRRKARPGLLQVESRPYNQPPSFARGLPVWQELGRKQKPSRPGRENTPG